MSYEQDNATTNFRFPNGEEHQIKGIRTPHVLTLLLQNPSESENGGWELDHLIAALEAQDSAFLGRVTNKDSKSRVLKTIIQAIDAQVQKFQYVVCTRIKEGKVYYSVLHQDEAQQQHDEGKVFYLREENSTKIIKDGSAVRLPDGKVIVTAFAHLFNTLLSDDAIEKGVTLDEVASLLFPAEYAEAMSAPNKRRLNLLREKVHRLLWHGVHKLRRVGHTVLERRTAEGIPTYAIFSNQEAQDLEDQHKGRIIGHLPERGNATIILDGVEIDLKNERYTKLFTLLEESSKGFVSYDQIGRNIFPERYARATAPDATRDDRVLLYQGIYEYLVDIMRVITNKGFAIMYLDKEGKRSLERRVFVVKSKLAVEIEQREDIPPKDKPKRLGSGSHGKR